MNQIKVLLLYGGESSEHEVSESSAMNVYDAINKEKYEVSLGYIDKEGRWWLVEDISSHTSSGMNQLFPVLGSGYFLTSSEEQKIQPDVILPVLHGKNGEDGAIAALAQLLHIPIVGCDMTAGAICMDKIATKKIAISAGIPIVPFKTIARYEKDVNYQSIIKDLGEALFIKPARAGSSVGVSRARSEEDFRIALEKSHMEDSVALIESAVDSAREIELAVLGTPPNHKVSAPGEILPDSEFYDYRSKYDSSSASKAVIPADLANDVASQLQQYALNTFEILGCSGLARVDFFIDKANDIYLNEINTFPGFTDISMYPKLWQYDDISYSQLIDELIADALQYK